jgi:hypothetical protein
VTADAPILSADLADEHSDPLHVFRCFLGAFSLEHDLCEIADDPGLR